MKKYAIEYLNELINYRVSHLPQAWGKWDM